MAEFVLSVWMTGDQPPDGAPIRLARVGEDAPLAEHPSGLDITGFRYGGADADPEDSLTAAGLMDEARKEAIGDQLWARLTPGPIGAALQAVIRDNRIYLDLRSDELLRLPWELLRCDNQYIFASANTRWALGSPEPTGHFGAGTPPEIEHPLRVLVVLGNRPDDQRIRAREELMVIEREAHLRNAEVLLTALDHPGPELIRRTLAEFRPHVFHFIGHGAGDPPQIFVHSSETDSDPWPAAKVRSVFAVSPPRLVVLNACDTAHAPTRASSLVRAFTDAGCRAVVAMMGAIRGAASEAFSRSFYEEIFGGAPVDAATTRARLAVLAAAGDTTGTVLEVRSNWALPRVTVRGDADAAIKMAYAGVPAPVTWLKSDFVTRWAERRQAWTAMDGTLKAGPATESRLAVLVGGPEAGKRELLNTMAEARARAGDEVVYVNVFGSRTGDWRDLLDRIADAAAETGLDPATLRAAARSGEPSGKTFEQFRAALERLPLPDGLPGRPLLLVLDGLSDWQEDVVEQTVLPGLCRPFLRAPATSRLRLMVTLEKPVGDQVWGPRPPGWQPVKVGNFDAAEWQRAVEHFRDYWCERVALDERAHFDDLAKTFAAFPMARSLAFMRAAAGGQS